MNNPNVLSSIRRQVFRSELLQRELDKRVQPQRLVKTWHYLLGVDERAELVEDVDAVLLHLHVVGSLPQNVHHDGVFGVRSSQKTVTVQEKKSKFAS